MKTVMAIWLAALVAIIGLAPSPHAQIQGVIFDTHHGGGAACTGPLDISAGTAQAAYGLRKMRNAYAGKAINISISGGAAQDVGFSGCDLNMTGLSGCTDGAGGTPPCAINKIYDQSGNAQDQVCTSHCGKYLLASCNGSLPCAIDFSTSDYTATFGSNLSATTNSYVVNFSACSSINSFYSQQPGGTVQWDGFCQSSNYTARRFDGSVHSATISASTATWYVGYDTFTASLSHTVLNGTAGTDNTDSLSAASNSVFDLFGTASFSFNGHWSESVAWNTNISDTNAKAVCRNQASYWGITTTC